ncbi:MAG: glycerol-3-phosphate 1-O-acyltransferase PlsY [Alphaproteobacteria bacterium]|nr:glycerol-3-phosphate 1-O-acyltransferase PlsY [Alphaproteobacteria bacterium]
MTSLLPALAASYLLGSIPCGLLLTRAAGLGDIRSIGSGNIGATNVLRTGNKPIALLTLLGDFGKGLAAVLIARAVWPDEPMLPALAALAAVLGHLFPVWLRFKGGKGVATALGVLAGLAWQVGLFAALAWLAVALVFRYSSLASLVAVALAPAAMWHFATGFDAGVVLVIAALVWLRHHENIRRLIGGTEQKIGKRNGGEGPPESPAVS